MSEIPADQILFESHSRFFPRKERNKLTKRMFKTLSRKGFTQFDDVNENDYSFIRRGLY